MKKINLDHFKLVLSRFQKFTNVFRGILGRITSRYNIIINYYVISILFMLVFTWLLIQVIGSNVLRHEAYVLKKEFVDRSKEFTKETAERISSFMENLDTLSVVDLVAKVSKQGSVAYMYVLNSSGEVIAHSVKSEMFKKYDDKYLDKKSLRYFISHINDIWTRKGEYKGSPVLRFSKPIILQFTKKDVIKELELSTGTGIDRKDTGDEAEKYKSMYSNKIVIPTGESANIDVSKKFYIAGVVHIAFSLDTLNLISDFSKRRVLVYYLISFLLAILLGYLLGKLIEASLRKSNLHLSSIIQEEEVNPIDLKYRVDSFKKLYQTINQLIHKFSQYTMSSVQVLNKVDTVYDEILSRIGAYMDDGIIITDELLRVEYANENALQWLGRKNEKIVNENISDILSKDGAVIDEINKTISRGAAKDQVSFRSGEITYYFYPVLFEKNLSKLLIIIRPGEGEGKGRIPEKKVPEAKIKTVQETKPDKTLESDKSRISSRLKKI